MRLHAVETVADQVDLGDCQDHGVLRNGQSRPAECSAECNATLIEIK